MRRFLVGCVAMLAACGTGGSAAPAPTGSPSPPAERCRTTNEVATALARFAAAFNSGDEATIRSTLSPAFWAFSITADDRHDVADGPDDAVRYIVARQRAGERLDFVRAQVNELAGWDGAAQIGPVVFRLHRAGDVFELQGKGALYCGGAMNGIKVLGLAEDRPTSNRSGP